MTRIDLSDGRYRPQPMKKAPKARKNPRRNIFRTRSRRLVIFLMSMYPRLAVIPEANTESIRPTVELPEVITDPIIPPQRTR